MQKTYAETQKELEAESQELKSLEAEKVKIIDAIDASDNALADVNEQLKKVEAMIKRANFLITKVGPMCAEETARCRLSKNHQDKPPKTQRSKIQAQG